jgi:hypothetical protein
MLAMLAMGMSLPKSTSSQVTGPRPLKLWKYVVFKPSMTLLAT